MRILGNKGEEIALRYLKTKGFRLLERNVTFSFGEIDLVMLDNNFLVFVEVRMRKNNLFGSPLETVNITKQKKIIKAAKAYLQKDINENFLSCRFDVIAITGSLLKYKISHIEDAFWDEESF